MMLHTGNFAFFGEFSTHWKKHSIYAKLRVPLDVVDLKPEGYACAAAYPTVALAKWYEPAELHIPTARDWPTLDKLGARLRIH